MKYIEVEDIINKEVFGNSFSIETIVDIAKNYKRFFSEYRIVSFKNKLIQNKTQSIEIKFGYAMEKIVEFFLIENGFEKINNKFKDLDSNKDYAIDQFFQNENSIYIVEQKMRDDHDSSKKVGQFINFQSKVKYLSEYRTEKAKYAYIYFIDEQHKKNKKYYNEQIELLKEQYKGVNIDIFYGITFFQKIKKSKEWEDLFHHIKMYKMKFEDSDIYGADYFKHVSDSDIKLAANDKKFIRSLEKLLINEISRKEIYDTFFINNSFLSRLLNYIKSDIIENIITEGTSKNEEK
ncbi:HpyAIV family type II restriction enzyme [Mesoplasma seiffertii]|uniref:HpyAIV family type II restriction enzyme n=1 Tax=Mesoplasma seiffertii TaxID=28224 RepID=UPI000479F5A9|nr:hypothetical protein [Mesoplasma seiffertii]